MLGEDEFGNPIHSPKLHTSRLDFYLVFCLDMAVESILTSENLTKTDPGTASKLSSCCWTIELWVRITGQTVKMLIARNIVRVEDALGLLIQQVVILHDFFHVPADQRREEGITQCIAFQGLADSLARSLAVEFDKPVNGMIESRFTSDPRGECPPLVC